MHSISTGTFVWNIYLEHHSTAMGSLDDKIYNRTLLEQTAAFHAAMVAKARLLPDSTPTHKNAKLQTSLCFIDKIVGKALLEGGRGARAPNVRHHNHMIWVLKSFSKAVSKTMSGLHEASYEIRVPDSLEETVELMYDGLLPFAFHVYESWKLGMKNLVLAAWFSHGRNGERKTLQGFASKCRDWSLGKRYAAVLTDHRDKLFLAFNMYGQYATAYHERYKISLEDLVVALTEAQVYSELTACQLADIRKNQETFRFQGFSATESQPHVYRFEAWWESFKLSMKAMQERGLNTGHTPFTTRALAAATPERERILAAATETQATVLATQQEAAAAATQATLQEPPPLHATPARDVIPDTPEVLTQERKPAARVLFTEHNAVEPDTHADAVQQPTFAPQAVHDPVEPIEEPPQAVEATVADEPGLPEPAEETVLEPPAAAESEPVEKTVMEESVVDAQEPLQPIEAVVLVDAAHGTDFQEKGTEPILDEPMVHDASEATVVEDAAAMVTVEGVDATVTVEEPVVPAEAPLGDKPSQEIDDPPPRRKQFAILDDDDTPPARRTKKDLFLRKQAYWQDDDADTPPPPATKTSKEKRSIAEQDVLADDSDNPRPPARKRSKDSSDGEDEDKDNDDDEIEEKPKPTKKSTKTKKPKHLVDCVTGEVYVLDVTGDPRSGNWHQIAVNVKYFHCPFCQVAYALGVKNPGYDTIQSSPANDGRLPIDQSIEQNQCRNLPLYKKMKRHLKKCVLERKISVNRDYKQQYERNVSFLETFYPPIFKSLPMLNDPSRIHKPDGKYDQTYARQERQKRLIQAAVQKAVEEDREARKREGL